jgi:Rod binding domain-containing protein
MATVPGAEDDEDAPGRDQMMSLGVQQLANSLAASGGIGIGKMIAKALHKAAEQPATPTATPATVSAASPGTGPGEARKIEK